jgi:hypothetical protein
MNVKAQMRNDKFQSSNDKCMSKPKRSKLPAWPVGAALSREILFGHFDFDIDLNFGFGHLAFPGLRLHLPGRPLRTVLKDNALA